jgi:uncharacterized protein
MTKRCNVLAAIVLAAVTIFAWAGSYESIVRAAQEGDTATVTSLLQRGMDTNTTDKDGNTLLMLAARGGYASLVDLLLKYKASYLKSNRFGDDAMLLAALNGCLDCVRSLEKAGAPLDREQPGWTPLLYAAFAGHTDIAAYLLDHDADVDAQSANGLTALMVAARNGHKDTVVLLLKHEADFELESDDGATALKLAMEGNNSEIARMLEAAGATR